MLDDRSGLASGRRGAPASSAHILRALRPPLRRRKTPRDLTDASLPRAMHRPQKVAHAGPALHKANKNCLQSIFARLPLLPTQ